jgi:hypothetical protein
MQRGNYNSLHELLVWSLIDYHLSVRGLCFSFGDHRWLLLFLAVIVRCQTSSWLFLQENRKKKKEKKELQKKTKKKIGCKKEHGNRRLDPQCNAFTKLWDYNYDFVFVTRSFLARTLNLQFACIGKDSYSQPFGDDDDDEPQHVTDLLSLAIEVVVTVAKDPGEGNLVLTQLLTFGVK